VLCSAFLSFLSHWLLLPFTTPSSFLSFFYFPVTTHQLTFSTFMLVVMSILNMNETSKNIVSGERIFQTELTHLSIRDHVYGRNTSYLFSWYIVTYKDAPCRRLYSCLKYHNTLKKVKRAINRQIIEQCIINLDGKSYIWCLVTHEKHFHWFFSFFYFFRKI
jgi:hypothetical protein